MVNLRSIEPITYTIVDLSHPGQGGNIDGIHDPNAIMDTIPYSRVFYHAFPGAIIMHRGTRYKIQTMNYPPCAADSSRYINVGTLCAFARPCSDRFTTRALSTTLITVVRQMLSVDLDPALIQNTQTSDSAFEPELGFGSLAGNGVVSIKKTVHGYKKLSLVNRTEVRSKLISMPLICNAFSKYIANQISRSELSLPSMEYDTNALWIDCEAQTLCDVMSDFDAGVHALSHAILAVAPLFVPCTSSDLDCDHSRFGCTRVLVFDLRPGGTGTSSQLWPHFFRPGGVLETAIDLLSECPLACDSRNYQGGCPGCLQSVPCVNFHDNMCRKAGLILARRMLGRIQMTPTFQSFKSDNKEMTPRRNARRKALQNALDLAPAKKRGIVIGRPSWPGDVQHDRCVEPIDTFHIEDRTISNKQGAKPSQGGFIT
jgi:DEAD/DEAH box helicase domain-containing protein